MVNEHGLKWRPMKNAMTADGTAWFGPAYTVEGWAPAPRYLLRRARVLDHLKKLPPGDVVEVGSASGALLSELKALGFTCVGLETSTEAVALARRVNANVQFRTEPDDAWAQTFDYCLSFEVLEHIENDGEALAQWSRWLRPGGRLLLSVPAHPRLWNARDVWAGHFRRYRRSDLKRLFEQAGLEVEKIECYGFPLANILEMIIAPSYRKYLNGETAEKAKVNKAEQTAASGIERTTHVKMFRHYTRFPGSFVMRMMIMLQNAFLSSDFGNGFLVMARKPER